MQWSTLLRRHLRDASIGILLALLTALIAGLVTGAPGAERQSADAAAREALPREPAAARDLTMTYRNLAWNRFTFDDGAQLADPTSPMERIEAQALDVLGPTQHYLAGATWSVQNELGVVTGAPKVDRGVSRLAAVRIQTGFDAHVTWIRGSAPTRASEQVTFAAETPATGETRTYTSRLIPVAMSEATATSWGLEVGERYVILKGPFTTDQPDPFMIVITGIYAPKDPTEAFWQQESRLIAPTSSFNKEGGTSGVTVFYTVPDNYGPWGAALHPLSRGARMAAEADGTSLSATGVKHQWRFEVDPARMTDARLDELASATRRLAAASWGAERPSVTTGIPDIVAAHRAAHLSTQAVAGLLVGGLVVLGLLTLALQAQVLIERRRPTIELLRARGATTGSTVQLLVREALAWVLPAAVVGGLVGVASAGRLPAFADLAALVALPVAVVLGVTWRTRRIARAATTRNRLSTPTGARAVAELLVLALAAFALSALLTTGSARQPDLLMALAPLLVTLAVGVILLRLHPLLVGLLAWPAIRARGVVAFLGLLRSSRAASAGLLPLVAILTGAALATSLAAVSVTMTAQRELAAYQRTGADVRVDAVRLDDADLERLRSLPGVTRVLPAWTEVGALGYAPDGQGSAAVSLVVVDTVAYAAMLADTPLAFEPTARGGAVDGRAPLLVSRSVDLAGGLDTVAIDDVTVPVRVVGTDAALTRLWGVKALPVVVIPREAASGLDATLGTNTALAQADSSMATAVLAAPPALLTGVTDRRAVARERATSAFPAFIGRLDLVGAIIGAALTALGLWLLVGIGRTARRDTVLLMRTLGLPERDQRRLEWLDVVPVVVVGGLAGIGLGLLLPRLLERVVDLRPFTGALVRTGIPPSLPAAAVVLAALAVLTILALTVDALGTRRAELTDHLRVGERR